MPIVADDKDWTWVLQRACPECGFDAAAFPLTELVSIIRSNAAEWPRLLRHPSVGTRPDDATWSALEYACHVRDVFRIYDRRLGWMRTQDGPTFPNWDQDAAAVDERYDEQDPATVAHEISTAAAALADDFDAVTGDEWQRTGMRSDGARFTIESFARYMVHDPVHHVWDVQRGYAALDGA